MPAVSTRDRRRFLATALPLLAAGLLGSTAAADTPAAGTGSAVDAARSRLDSARSGAAAQDTALSAAQQDMAAARAQLAAAEDAVARADAAVAAAQSAVDRLSAQERADQQRLAGYLRSSYEKGLDASFVYIVGADSLGVMLQRQSEVSHVADAMERLAGRVRTERTAAGRALAEATASRARVGALGAQARAAADVVANQRERVAAADAAAHAAVAQAQRGYSAAQTAARAQAQAAAAAAAAAAQRRQHPPAAPAPPSAVYAPVAGPSFTADTDLTLPSGLTAARIDAFLDGTPLAGLGGAFMAAEGSYHVSARFMVALAVNESAWGRSAIAQDKHNLFGYLASDAQPYQSAMSFPSFAACIDTVSRQIARDYLSPGGVFYHGPTLRGVGILYASDPAWADKTAAIGREIP